MGGICWHKRLKQEKVLCRKGGGGEVRCGVVKPHIFFTAKSHSQGLAVQARA